MGRRPRPIQKRREAKSQGVVHTRTGETSTSTRGCSIRDSDRPAAQTGKVSPHASGQWDMNTKGRWAVKLPIEAQVEEADR